MKAIIPAAGLGTRLYPITKNFAKELLPILDKSCIEYAIDYCLSAGIEDIRIVVNLQKFSMFTEYFNYHPKYKHYVTIDIQKEQKGLPHCIYTQEDFIGNDSYFVVVLPDMIVDKCFPIKNMLEVHNKFNNPIVGLFHVESEDTCKYGMVEARNIENSDTKIYKLLKFIEKPNPDKSPSSLAMSGHYILPKETFEIIFALMGKYSEVTMSDVLHTLYKTYKFSVYGYKMKAVFDTGNFEDYVKTLAYFQHKKMMEVVR